MLGAKLSDQHSVSDGHLRRDCILLAQAGTNGATVNLSSLTNSIQTMQTNLAAMLDQVLNGLTNGTAADDIRDALAESTLGGMSICSRNSTRRPIRTSPRRRDR